MGAVGPFGRDFLGLFVASGLTKEILPSGLQTLFGVGPY